MLIPIDEPVGNLRYVERVVTIPAIEFKEGDYAEVDVPLEVTCHSDLCRRFVSFGATIYSKSGQVLFSGSQEAVNLAMRGGGIFREVFDNDEYTVQTEEEALNDELEYADYPDW